MEQNVVLEMRGINKNFPGVKALQDVDFTLRKGEIHALMGENGAGKSTLIKVLTGVEEFETGTIRMEGSSNTIINRSPQEAQENGISTVYQEVNLCPNLSVAENLYIGREPKKGPMIDWRTMKEDARKLLEGLDVHIDVTMAVENYSIAIQQMIAIARAVDMSAKVLILDEPTSSLDDGEVEKLFVLMRQLKDKGIGIIFVTHFLEQVYAVCDRITVLRNGTLVGEFKVEELPRVQLVAKMMGKDFDDLAAIKKEGVSTVKEEVIISARGLGHKGTIKRENIIIALQAKKGMFRLMSRKEQEEFTDKYIDILQIKTADRETPIKQLSGGNQQKVILGRWLLTNPDFLILDEPTRGIDIGTKTEIQKLVLKLAEDGMSVVFISSEIEEMLRTCSRMAVMRDGGKVGELKEDELSQDSIMKAIAGGGEE